MRPRVHARPFQHHFLPVWIGSLLAVAAVSAWGTTWAQMPDLRQMSGRPLPVADLPVGTVSVRVARKMPVNAAAGIEVRARVTPASGGEPQEQTATTGEDGRTAFENLPAGASFQATAVVDGETLQTQEFAIPASGGVRTMLIAGLGEATAESEAAVAPQPKLAWAITVPAPTPASDLPAGTLEATVFGEDGKPLSGHKVTMGQAGGGSEVRAFEQISDDRGLVRFDDLSTAQEVGYLLVTEIGGVRIGSRPFRMPVDSGMRLARLAPPARTSDPSILSLDQASRFIFEVREDFLFVGQVLSFRNETDRVFDGGPGGLFLPLPSEMVSFQPFDDSAKVEELKGKGLLMRSPVPPTGPRGNTIQARFAYLLPTYGDDTLEFEQPLPIAMKSPLLIIPDSHNLTVKGEGLRVLPKEKDQQGNPISLYEMPSIPAGGALKLTFSGLPKIDRSGHMLVLGVSLVLLAWGIWGVASAKRADTGKLDRKRQDLRNRREKLFDELLSLEQRRGGGTDVDAHRREQLVSQLESVYRDLHSLDKQV